MADCSTFASALRKVWKDSGLRQEEFAERLGYRRPTVANMIRGSHLPPLEFLGALEEAFPGSHQILEPLLHRERQQREHEKERRALARHTAPITLSWKGEDPQPYSDLSGTWYAVWETIVEGKPSFDTEVLGVKQTGNRVAIENEAASPDNPTGAYLWSADCVLHDNAFLMGSYGAIDSNDRQRGVMFFNIHRSGQFMVGRWVGCTYDEDMFDGLTVIARQLELAHTHFNKAFGRDVLPLTEDERTIE